MTAKFNWSFTHNQNVTSYKLLSNQAWITKKIFIISLIKSINNKSIKQTTYIKQIFI